MTIALFGLTLTLGSWFYLGLFLVIDDYFLEGQPTLLFILGTLVIPVVVFGSLLLVTIAYPLRPLQYIRRRRGLCIMCGYDLRCSPEQCPECGQRRDMTA